MDDASLDDFLAPEESSDDADETESVDGSGTDESTEPDTTAREAVDEAATVSPAHSTMASSPSTEECAACGSSVRRRWRDDDGLVCRECKSW